MCAAALVDFCRVLNVLQIREGGISYTSCKVIQRMYLSAYNISPFQQDHFKLQHFSYKNQLYEYVMHYVHVRNYFHHYYYLFDLLYCLPAFAILYEYALSVLP